MIAEAEHIVPVGMVPPDAVKTPGVLVEHLLGRGHVMDAREIIARRVAREIRHGTLVNLGISLPRLAANYVPEEIGAFFQAENRVIGLGARPRGGMEEASLTDAGGGFVTAVPGAASIDSAMSFGLIRDGHLDRTVPGGLQVDACWRLAN